MDPERGAIPMKVLRGPDAVCCVVGRTTEEGGTADGFDPLGIVTAGGPGGTTVDPLAPSVTVLTASGARDTNGSGTDALDPVTVG